MTVNLIPRNFFDRWEKWVQGKFVPVVSTESKVGMTWGPLLTFDGVTSNCNGTYRCEVFHSLGRISYQMDLIVEALPKVELHPKKRTVRTGQNVELNCETPDVATHAELT